MTVEQDLQAALDRACHELGAIRMELGCDGDEDLLTVVKQTRLLAMQAGPNQGGTTLRDVSACLDTLRRAYGFKVTVTRHGSANTWNATIDWQGEQYNHAGLLDDNLLRGIMGSVADMVQRHKDKVTESLAELSRRGVIGPEAPTEPRIIRMPGGDHDG